jgi:hypothetical protein
MLGTTTPTPHQDAAHQPDDPTDGTRVVAHLLALNVLSAGVMGQGKAVR